LIRERPLKERAITLVKLENIYFWTCSACYWKTSFGLALPIALEEFDHHDCLDHPAPTGI
jgi:hypothetical protein